VPRQGRFRFSRQGDVVRGLRPDLDQPAATAKCRQCAGRADQSELVLDRGRSAVLSGSDIQPIALAADFVWSIPFCAIDDTANPPETTSRFCANK
jgi:hypothetical protein